jgi:hypothetical protein
MHGTAVTHTLTVTTIQWSIDGCRSGVLILGEAVTENVSGMKIRTGHSVISKRPSDESHFNKEHKNKVTF